MSVRVRRPTDDVATEIYDPERQRAVLQKPAPAAPLTPLFTSFEQDLEQDPTEVTPIPMRGPIELATPTEIESAPSAAAAPADPRPPAEPAAAVERRRGLERSEPIRMISMKDQTEAGKRQYDDARVPLHVQLRSMAEVAGHNDTPVELGRLAPPRDPKAARARHVRANVIWACVAVVLACAISLAIWLVAGR